MIVVMVCLVWFMGFFNKQDKIVVFVIELIILFFCMIGN